MAGLAATILLITPTLGTAQASSGILWGGDLASLSSGVNWPFDADGNAAILSSFTGDAGKAPSVLGFGNGFCAYQATCQVPHPAYDTFAATAQPYLQDAVDAGAIPVFSWASDPGDSDAAIAAGAEDAYIRAWAAGAAAWRRPFFLRFDWEMNGNWFPWGTGPGNPLGNSPYSYVAMWRHVYDIFRDEGATNVTFVWTPDIDPQGGGESSSETGYLAAPLDALWPGSRYVGWMGLDGYNHAGDWRSWSSLFGATYDTLTGFSPAPIMVAETASQENTEPGESKAGWISALFASLPTEFPRIHALLWFNISQVDDLPTGWPIETSASAMSAFAFGVGSSRYPANDYGSLGGTGPIAPPTVSLPASSPAADVAGRTSYTYSVGPGGRLIAYSSAGSGWSSRDLVGTPVAAGGSPSVAEDGAGDQFVFYPGANGSLHLWRHQHGSWSNFSLGGVPMATDSSPVATIDAAGDIDAFYVGSDANVWQWAYSTASGTWTNSELGGSPGGSPVAADASPALATDPAGDHLLVYPGADGSLREWRSDGGSWQNVDLAGAPEAPDTSPTVVVDSAGDTYAYYVARGGQIWAWQYTSSGETWSNIELGGSVGGEPAAADSSPRVAIDSQGNQFVFYTGADHSLHLWRLQFGSWMNFTWGGEPVATGSTPAVRLDSSGGIYAYDVGADGNQWDWQYTSAGGWTNNKL